MPSHACTPSSSAPSRPPLLAGEDYTDLFTQDIKGNPPSPAQLLAAFLDAPPGWLRLLMRLRDRLVAPLGLKTGIPTQAPGLLPPLAAGQRYGLFRVVALAADEIVLGEDDRHLDFRLALRSEARPGGARLVLRTSIRRHNALGRAYFAVVRPVHRHIMPITARRMAARLEQGATP